VTTGSAGSRFFNYSFESAAAEPALHRPLDFNINGLQCSPSNASVAAEESLLQCNLSSTAGCAPAWFCCGDELDVLFPTAIPPPASPPPLPPPPLPAPVQRGDESSSTRTVAVAVGTSCAATIAAAAALLALRRRAARRRAAAASDGGLDAQMPPADGGLEGNGDTPEGGSDGGTPRGALTRTRSMPALSRRVTFVPPVIDEEGGQGGSVELTGGSSFLSSSGRSLLPLRSASASLRRASTGSVGGAVPAGWSLPAAATPDWSELRGSGGWATMQPPTSSSHSSSSASSGGAPRRSPSIESCAGGHNSLHQIPSNGVLSDLDFDAEIELESLLGSGAFGAVYAVRPQQQCGASTDMPALSQHSQPRVQGRWRRLGSAPVAIKMLHNVDGPDALRNFAGEVAVLARLSHRNIVRLLGACLTPPNACMIEELVEGGSLHAFLHGPTGRRCTHAELLGLADDIALAMVYLHPTVVHRDLKPQNVLLDRDFRAKVCDFGIAKVKQHTLLSTLSVGAGTPAYMAPELFSGGGVGERVDVWSFGTLLWEMHTGKQPWRHLTTPVQVIFAIAVQRERLPMSEACPSELAQLMTACWAQVPDERPPFASILETLRSMACAAGLAHRDEDSLQRTA